MLRETIGGHEMALTLYSGPLSLFSAKSRIALAEKGLDHTLIQVGWNRQDRYLPHHPEVVRLNPKCQVPILIDGDVVVCDSTLIAEYLEERFPTPLLFPRELAQRARCRHLEMVADEVWFPRVWDLIESRFYPTGDAAEAGKRAAAAEDKLACLFADLDKQLQDRNYLCGELSVADIAMIIFVNAAVSLGATMPQDAANVRAWSERMLARPSVARVAADLAEAAAAALAAGPASRVANSKAASGAGRSA
jgi:glutathione S-transferase